MDVCTLLLSTTLLAIPCSTHQSCGVTLEGSRKICMDYCETPPPQYSCVKPDGTSYIWTPEHGEDTIITTDLKNGRAR